MRSKATPRYTFTRDAVLYRLANVGRYAAGFFLAALMFAAPGATAASSDAPQRPQQPAGSGSITFDDGTVDADGVEIREWRKPVQQVKPKVKPGTVLTSSGRVAKPRKSDGCLWLTYAELGHPEAGDPGDGEWFCPR